MTAIFLELASWFRINVANRPFWLFIIVFATLLAILPRLQGRSRSVLSTRPARVGLAAGILIAYVSLAIWYVLIPQYVDHAEPSIASVAWLFDVGRPVYHGAESAERYAHMYGPLSFILPGAFLAALGPSLQASKAAGVAAGLSGLVLVWVLMRRARTSRVTAFLLSGLFAASCLMFRHFSFWIRPDSFSLLFVTVGLLAASSANARTAVTGVGIALGVMANLKLTGPLYLLSGLGLIAARFGLSAILMSGIVGLLTLALPFALFDNVSLTNYLHWVRISAGNGLEFRTLRQNIEWAIFLLLFLAPCVVVGRPEGWDRKAYISLWIGLLLGMAGVAIAASKPGAGAYHLMPFLPTVIFILALHTDQLDALRTQPAFQSGQIGLAVVIASVAFSQQLYFLQLAHAVDGDRALADLRGFADSHAGARIAMGYGDHDEGLAMLRPLLVFREGSYSIDLPAVQEYQMSGLELPTATTEAVKTCQEDFWLFPRNGEPFTARNHYPVTGYRLLFPEDFRVAFLAAYEHNADTQLYQVWSCRAGSKPR